MHSPMISGVVLVAWIALLRAGPAIAGTGDMDPSYGDKGSISSDSLVLLGALGDGSLLAEAGFSRIVRMDADGLRDSNFGTNGYKQLPAGFNPTYGSTLRTPDGKLLLGGSMEQMRGGRKIHDFAILRFDAAGNLDPSFGLAGIVTRPAEELSR